MLPYAACDALAFRGAFTSLRGGGAMMHRLAFFSFAALPVAPCDIFLHAPLVVRGSTEKNEK